MNTKNLTDIDVKDKKILYELDIDARQSFSQIGKKVGLPKTVVAYRVHKLQETGFIKNFHATIDSTKLGYIWLRSYFNYQYATPEIKKEIIEHFTQSKFSIIVHSVEGSYDLVVFMAVKNLLDFYPFWEETLNKYRDYFANQIFSIYYQEHTYQYSFLIDAKIKRKKDTILNTGEQAIIDELDRQLLYLIAPNARIPLTEIAKKLHSTSEVILYRIKKLIKLGIIQKFKVNIDFSKLGYSLYKVDLVLKDRSKLNQIIKYVETNSYFICRDITIGYTDLELEFILKNTNQLHQIMEDLTVKFPKSIRNYTYFRVETTHKTRYIPEF